MTATVTCDGCRKTAVPAESYSALPGFEHPIVGLSLQAFFTVQHGAMEAERHFCSRACLTAYYAGPIDPKAVPLKPRYLG